MENKPNPIIRRKYHPLPKVELHAHLSGSLSDEFAVKLLQRKYEQISTDEVSELLSTLKMGNRRSLPECMKVFKTIHMLMDSISTVRNMTYLVLKEFSEDNVRYLELRTTPKSVENSSKKEYLEAVLESIREVENTLGITVRLLVSIDRSRGIDDAWDSLRIIEELLTHDVHGNYICGIDVSGDPYAGSLLEYIPVLEKAKELDLKLAVHLYEVNTATAFEEGKEIINRGLVDRIGHATFLHPSTSGSKAMTDIVKEKKIPIELCITSNIKCGSVADFGNHHTNIWHKENHPIAICTDDKGVFSTTMSNELELYAKAVNGNLKDIQAMTLASLQFSFLEEKTKENLLQQMKDEMDKLT